MLEKFKYVNHMNETLEFGANGLYVNENDLRNFAWSITSKNDRISGFKKGIVSKSIPILLKCNTAEEGIALKNKLFEVFEKDVLAVKHGKIIIGDYYLKCFVIESAKSDYLLHKSYLKITVKVSTDFPYWVKETSSTFNYGNEAVDADLDFNRDHPYDYTSNLLGKQLNNTHFVKTNFRINIYGACENPRITVSGHKYEVAASIGENEYLTIDSTNKSIILTHGDGSQENMFNKRNKESYIFEKMPPGISNVSASGSFKFDIVLLEERGEPRWI
jgi:hypothetical protein